MSVESNDYKVAFDYGPAVQYATCMSCCMATSTFIGILCVPCFCFCTAKATRNQRCSVDDRRVHFKGGYWNQFDRVVPLDRIQDLNISQDWVQNLCGTNIVSIYTAGTGGGEAGTAELTLVGPQNPKEVRGVILAKRDALVLGHAASGQQMSYAPGDGLGSGGMIQGGNSQPAGLSQMVAQLDELNRTVSRIEHQIHRGLGGGR